MHIIVLGVLSGKLFAYAPTFGPEWTFTNLFLEDAYEGSERIANDKALYYLQRIKILLQEIQKRDKNRDPSWTFTIHDIPDYRFVPNFLVKYRNGYFVNITLDSRVVEVRAKSVTLEEWKRVRKWMGRDIFATMRELDLHPSGYLGFGHINIGLRSAFGTNLRLYRNFIVDQYNSPFLYALGNPSPYLQMENPSSYALCSLSAVNRFSLKGLIKAVDNYRIRSIEELTDLILAEVFNGFPDAWHPLKYGGSKSQQLGLKTITDPNVPDQLSEQELLDLLTEKPNDPTATATKPPAIGPAKVPISPTRAGLK